ncbi:MAG: hydroxyphenylacetyl-CoA thioesterase PaaI [Rhodospirillales bacterium]|nr:hydroxyphenylacetyl-CoA thioesterase PaaI [Rhodospirillales bacterium]MCW9002603.1 hydroxyphenylacetyl-CoA thioesterase PaaI [Rhodospirillales bacterium]
MTKAGMNEQEIAERVMAAIAERDRLYVNMGMETVAVEPGGVTIRMTIRDDMLNGLDICHGGSIFSLADVAFAAACNNRNHNMVAFSCTVSFLRAARVGDVLTATARETMREGRNGIYDITVTDQNGHIIAEFRGQSRSVKGHMLPELAESEEK